MISEEIGLNDYLEGNGVVPVETDLGEYIIQLRHEAPSHIIAPAAHLTKQARSRRNSVASTPTFRRSAIWSSPTSLLGRSARRAA